MTLVVDASLVVAGLVDNGPVGTWAADRLESDDLAAPHLMPGEVANMLRRASLAGEISAESASLAHADLVSLQVSYYPYEPFAERVWDLRQNITSYDAWYVAVAESLDTWVATIDLRLRNAPGPRCKFVTPPHREPGHD